MEGNGTRGRKKEDGIRKVRCPTCRNLLIEPSDHPVYCCGVCNTILQAKYYKGPPVNGVFGSMTSESTQNNGSENKPEANMPMENVSKQDVPNANASELSTATDNVSECGSYYSDENSERSYDTQESSKDHEKGTNSTVLGGQLEKSLVLSTGGSESSFHSSASDAEPPAVTGPKFPEDSLPKSGSEIDNSRLNNESIFNQKEEPTVRGSLLVKSMEAGICEQDYKATYFNSEDGHLELEKVRSNENGTDAVNLGKKVEKVSSVEIDVSEIKPPSPVSCVNPAICETDESIQESKLLPLQEQESIDGDMSGVISEFESSSASDSSSRAVPGVGCTQMTLPDSFSNTDSSTQESDLSFFREQEAASGDKIGMHAMTTVHSESEKSSASGYISPEVSGEDSLHIILPEGECEDGSLEKNELLFRLEREPTNRNIVSTGAVTAVLSESERPSTSGSDGGCEVTDSMHERELFLQEREPTGGDTIDILYVMEDVPSESNGSTSHFYSKQWRREPNLNGSKENERQVVIPSKQVKKNLAIEAIQLENSLPSISEGSDLSDSKKISSMADISGNTIKIGEKMPNCESVSPIMQQDFMNANNKVMNSTMEMLDSHSEQCIPTENMKPEMDEKKHMIVISTEQAEESLAVETDELGSKLEPSDGSLMKSENVPSNGNTSYSGFDVEMIPPKEGTEDIQMIETFSMTGDSSLLGSVPESSEQQCHEMENCQSLENKVESNCSNVEMRSMTSLCIHETENVKAINKEKEQLKSSDNTMVVKVNTIDAQTRDGEGGHGSPFSHRPHLVLASKSHRSSESGSKDWEGDVNVSQEHVREREYFQGWHNTEAVRSHRLNQAGPSSRNNVHGFFQRNPSGMSVGSHSAQNWIESERENLLRSLSMCSDSTELDHERMELLNKIDELRYQLLGIRGMSRNSSAMPYMEAISHLSQPSISELDEFPLPSAGLPWHSHAVSRTGNYSDRESILPQRTQSPRNNTFGSHRSPQQFSLPIPCIHRNCRGCCHICTDFSESDVISRDSHRHNHEPERRHRMERDHEQKRYCRPFQGAAQFVSCYECFEVLQIPENFDVLSSKYKHLRCGSCHKILELSICGKTQITSDALEVRQSIETNVASNGYKQEGPGFYTKEDYSRSLGKNYSSKGEHMYYISGNSGVPTRRRAGKQIPLHSLMGYRSASEVIKQEQNDVTKW